jgi:hypothetical protein
MDQDWIRIRILFPPEADLKPLFDTLKAMGFVQNDILALNRLNDGAYVGWGSYPPPRGPRPYRWEVG